MSQQTCPASRIQIGNTVIQKNQAYIIAEMACAHDGDAGKARDLIDIAVESGCDAVQLQFFNAEANVIQSHQLLPLLHEIEFSTEQWEELVGYARGINIHVFACAYDAPSLELAIELQVDGIKFNSADLNNLEMLTRVATSGLAFTLGTGASRLDEIGLAIETVLANGGERFILMHGMQSFPTEITHANIRRLQVLSTGYETLTGYADHTAGDDPFAVMIDLLALGCGACVFEKHYTLDRSQEGTDYQAALNPDDLSRYVTLMRQGVKALGSSAVMPFTPEEENYRQFQKKRIVAARAIQAGEVLAREDLLLLRTEVPAGVSAGELQTVIGKTLTKDIALHQPVLESDLNND